MQPPYDPDCPECGGTGFTRYYTAHLEQSIADSCSCAHAMSDDRFWRGDGWLPGVECIPARFFGQLLVPSKVHRFVIHCGKSRKDNFGAYFANPHDGDRWRVVSAHGAILDDGRWQQYVPASRVAWHAQGANYDSIGYELQGPPTRDDWPEVVIDRLVTVIQTFAERYPITTLCSHRALAPLRRTDPGPHFPWAALQDRFPTMGIVP